MQATPAFAVGDFSYPCGVYSVLWVLSQVNPGDSLFLDIADRVEEDNRRQRNPVRNLEEITGRRISQADWEDAFTMKEILNELAALSHLNKVTWYFIEAEGLGDVSPTQLVESGLVDPNVYTLLHYPYHYIVTGPQQMTPEHQARWMRFARLGGFSTPTGPLRHPNTQAGSSPSSRYSNPLRHPNTQQALRLSPAASMFEDPFGLFECDSTALDPAALEPFDFRPRANLRDSRFTRLRPRGSGRRWIR